MGLGGAVCGGSGISRVSAVSCVGLGETTDWMVGGSSFKRKYTSTSLLGLGQVKWVEVGNAARPQAQAQSGGGSELRLTATSSDRSET